MRISLIVAMAENRVIGRENRLPWHLPEDLKRFRQLTSGHPVIMGRKTYESIGRLLPNRENIILTRRAGYQVPGATILGSIEEALEHCRRREAERGGGEGTDEVFVIGGGEIYQQSLPHADRIHLTVVHRMVEGDAVFPEINSSEFKEMAREDHHEPFPFSFLTLDRVR